MKKILLVVLLFAFTLTACSGAKPVTLEGTQRDDFLAKSEPIADNLMKGMVDHNYDTFSKDLSPKMLKSIDAAAFKDMLSKLDPKIGAYQSRTVEQVLKIGGDTAVIYQAKYSDEDKVSVRLVFSTTDPLQVTGLWFDSAKLREK